MSETLYVLVLAVLQGIAEFLPISSSGHLVIGKSLLSEFWPDAVSTSGGMQLEVALHAGTLGSILLVFAKDLWQLRRDWRLCLLIILASIPAGVVGITLKKSLEPMFESPLVAGCGLLVTAIFLLLGQKLASGKYTERDQPWATAFVVGCFQAIALVPGISRSGSTIAGGLLTGLQRIAAAKFSFLMAIPAIGGATLLEAKDLLIDGTPLAYGLGSLTLGIIVSFVVGIAALRLLLLVVARGQLHWFAYYCLTAGMLTILWQLLQ
ncbi:MAG: undecaprenyl-diphosphate phosphatase [Planctomycetaceae bacterium]